MRTCGKTDYYCRFCGYDTEPPDRDGNSEIFCPLRDGDFCEPKRRGLRAGPHRQMVRGIYGVPEVFKALLSPCKRHKATGKVRKCRLCGRWVTARGLKKDEKWALTLTEYGP